MGRFLSTGLPLKNIDSGKLRAKLDRNKTSKMLKMETLKYALKIEESGDIKDFLKPFVKKAVY